MSNTFFVTLYAATLALLLVGGFRVLAGERWQFLATVPLVPKGNGQWRGLNLTWYGFFSATAYTVATATAMTMLFSVGADGTATAVMAIMVIGICAPMAKIIARLVEGKKNTFTVGGAVFTGVVIAWPTAWLVDHFIGLGAPPMAALAALSVSYTVGEGIGRLACISFGCCYGRPVDDLPERWRPLVNQIAVRFTGATKKACYESHFHDRPLVPAQGITATLYVSLAVVGLFLFSDGRFTMAMLVTLMGTQLWRLASEWLRADWRGTGRLSKYQWMALIGALYAPALALLVDEGTASVVLADGFLSLWTPGTLIGLQALWLASFIYTGRSGVTYATLSFAVDESRI